MENYAIAIIITRYLKPSNPFYKLFLLIYNLLPLYCIDFLRSCKYILGLKKTIINCWSVLHWCNLDIFLNNCSIPIGICPLLPLVCQTLDSLHVRIRHFVT